MKDVQCTDTCGEVGHKYMINYKIDRWFILKKNSV